MDRKSKLDGACGNTNDELSENDHKGEKPKRTTSAFPLLMPKNNSLVIGESFLHIVDPFEKNQESKLNTEEKVLPVSQQTITEYPCTICNRKFASRGGRSTHLKSCKKKNQQKENMKIENKGASTKDEMVPTDKYETNNNVESSHLKLAEETIKIWDSHTKNDIHQIISSIYEEIVK